MLPTLTGYSSIAPVLSMIVRCSAATWRPDETRLSCSGCHAEGPLWGRPPPTVPASAVEQRHDVAAQEADLVDQLAAAPRRDSHLEMGDTHVAQRPERRRHLLGVAGRGEGG